MSMPFFYGETIESNGMSARDLDYRTENKTPISKGRNNNPR